MFRMTRLLLSTSPMMRGDDVLMLQRRLAALGVGPTQDGLYGDGTAGAVRKFQLTQGLEVDGIVGPQTWKGLFGDADVPPSSQDLTSDSLSGLGTMHGYYKDGCHWRLGVDGIEVEGAGLLTFSTPDRTQAAGVLTRFRQELIAALAVHPVPIELLVACICVESNGRPEALRKEPGCDRDNPENTPWRVSVGLTQTLLSTARLALRQPELRLIELLRPETSILAGAAYVEQQSLQTRYDPPLVAATYNAGSLRYNRGAENRWKLLQYPIGTARYVDNFLHCFNAVMALVDTVELPDHVPSMRRSLKGTATSRAGIRPGPPSPSAAGTTGHADIAGAIRNAAVQLGVDGETLAAIAFIESGFRVDEKNRNSSAFGLFQFLNDTWADMVRRHGATLGISAGDRGNLRAQCLMGAAFLQDNMHTLQNALGREPQPEECYAAHFFGAFTAARLLQGGRDTRADIALGDRAEEIIGANKPIFFDGGRTRTVGEVMDEFDTKMRGAQNQARALLGSALTSTPEGAASSGTAAASEAAQPRWLAIALGEIGQKEAAGTADNPRIVEYFGATTLGSSPDSVPWCGAFVSFCMRQAGIIDKGSARAADWMNFGESLGQPRLGCIAVLKPQAERSSGHVGFLIKEEGALVQLLAGNQHDRVDITAYPVTALREGGLRWPRGVA
jgi:uncharacterized protein (TIGR02594 family)